MIAGEAARDPTCFFCGGSRAGVDPRTGWNGARPGVWRRATPNEVPCDACATRMAGGVMLVEVDDARSAGPKDPFRTGNFAVVAEEGIRRVISPQKLADRVLELRYAFVSLENWEALGLDGHDGGRGPVVTGC